MAGNAPGRAGTRHGVERKQTSRIVRHRNTCANCATPITGRNSHCRTCITWLAIYARTVEIAKLLQAVQP